MIWSYSRPLLCNLRSQQIARGATANATSKDALSSLCRQNWQFKYPFDNFVFERALLLWLNDDSFYFTRSSSASLAFASPFRPSLAPRRRRHNKLHRNNRPFVQLISWTASLSWDLIIVIRIIESLGKFFTAMQFIGLPSLAAKLNSHSARSLQLDYLLPIILQFHSAAILSSFLSIFWSSTCSNYDRSIADCSFHPPY